MPGQSPMLAACSILPHSAPTLSIRWSFIIAMFIFHMSPIISLIWGLILTVVALREGFQKNVKKAQIKKRTQRAVIHFCHTIQIKAKKKIRIKIWGPYVVHFKHRDSPYVVHFICRDSPYVVHFKRRDCPYV